MTNGFKYFKAKGSGFFLFSLRKRQTLVLLLFMQIKEQDGW
jgi:hypothetical protein